MCVCVCVCVCVCASERGGGETGAFAIFGPENETVFGRKSAMRQCEKFVSDYV